MRTKSQGIFIVSHINADLVVNDFNGVCLHQNEKVAFGSIEEIEKLKHSKNIIDLIEVGDVIKYVEQTEGKEGTELYGIYIADIHNEMELMKIKEEIKQTGIKILSIVTKEQFASMEYRLEV